MAPSATRRGCLAWSASALGLGALNGLAGCMSPPLGQGPPGAAPGATDALPTVADRVMPFSGTPPGQAPVGWHPYAVRRDLRPTQYAARQLHRREVLHAQASSSATGLRCPVQINPASQAWLRFGWQVRDVPARADVAVAEHDDCPARLVLAFGGDDTRLPLRDRLFFEQVELFTGNRLPFATLMYVWDGGRHAPETVHRNHRSSRIQYLVVESGGQRAGQWLAYQRNVVADYQRVFGEAPGPIVSVGVLTDADALKTNMEAWYGDITLSAHPA